MDVDIRDLQVGELSILKPKRHHDSLFGRIADKEDKAVEPYFYNISVVKHKRITHHDGAYTVLYLRAGKDVVHKMIEFDEFCKTHVKLNASKLFTKSLDENVIDEYYSSSVTITPRDGCLIKLKLQNAEDDLLEALRYDLLLSVKGLRFYKQRFVAEWELCGIRKLENDFIGSYADSDDDALFEAPGDMGEVDVLNEDISTITSELIDKVNVQIKDVSAKMVPLDERLKHLTKISAELADPKVPKTVTLLDEIADGLDN